MKFSRQPPPALPSRDSSQNHRKTLTALIRLFFSTNRLLLFETAKAMVPLMPVLEPVMEERMRAAASPSAFHRFMSEIVGPPEFTRFRESAVFADVAVHLAISLIREGAFTTSSHIPAREIFSSISRGPPLFVAFLDYGKKTKLRRRSCHLTDWIERGILTTVVHISSVEFLWSLSRPSSTPFSISVKATKSSKKVFEGFRNVQCRFCR